MHTIEELEPTVYIVDDDAAVREWLRNVMKTIPVNARFFSSALEFIEEIGPEQPGCVVSDIRMPQMDGLQLQEQLKRNGVTLPIVFITGYADVPMAVKAIKNGAFELLEKPIRSAVLIETIQKALAFDATSRRGREVISSIQQHLAQLTPREKMVLPLIIDGEPNKIIADRLGIAEKTVEIHRSHIMHKMGAKSLAKLVEMVLTARGGAPAESTNHE